MMLCGYVHSVAVESCKPSHRWPLHSVERRPRTTVRLKAERPSCRTFIHHKPVSDRPSLECTGKCFGGTETETQRNNDNG